MICKILQSISSIIYYTRGSHTYALMAERSLSLKNIRGASYKDRGSVYLRDAWSKKWFDLDDKICRLNHYYSGGGGGVTTTKTTSISFRRDITITHSGVARGFLSNDVVLLHIHRKTLLLVKKSKWCKFAIKPVFWVHYHNCAKAVFDVLTIYMYIVLYIYGDLQRRCELIINAFWLVRYNNSFAWL